MSKYCARMEHDLDGEAVIITLFNPESPHDTFCFVGQDYQSAQQALSDFVPPGEPFFNPELDIDWNYQEEPEIETDIEDLMIFGFPIH